MLFSSTIFLFAFLPVVVSTYLLLRGTTSRNALLLSASLIFYAWGEPRYIALLFLSIGANFAFGLWIDRRRGQSQRLALTTAVAANLALLGVESRLQRVSVDDDVYHRVRIGPTSDLDELNAVRRQLWDAEIEVMLIKVPD